MSEPTPGAANAELAQQIYDTVSRHPAVHSLHGGPFNAIASFVPGQRLTGVAVNQQDDPVEVAVILHWGARVPQVDRELRDALRPLIGRRRLDLTVADVKSEQEEQLEQQSQERSEARKQRRQEVAGTVGESARQAGQRARDLAQESTERTKAGAGKLGEHAGSLASQAREQGSAAGERAGALAGQAKERTGELAGQTQQKAGEWAGQVRERADELTDSERTQQWASGTKNFAKGVADDLAGREEGSESGGTTST